MQDSFLNDPSKEVDLTVCIESQKEVSSIAKNDINAKDRKRVESDTEEDAIDTTQKRKKAKPNLSSDGVNEGDKFELSTGEKNSEEFSYSGH